MADIIVNFLKTITDNNVLIVILSSMVPLIELKGAIPVGVALGLEPIVSALLSYLGSTLIIIPIFFLLIPIFNLLKKIPGLGRLIKKLEAVLRGKAEDVAKKTDGNTEEKTRKILRIALLIFVSIPLPLTGVWTGAAIAVFLEMSFKDSIIPLALGNFIAGSVIFILTLLFEKWVNTIITVIFIIAIIMLIVTIIKVLLSKPKEEEKEEVTNEKAE